MVVQPNKRWNISYTLSPSSNVVVVGCDILGYAISCGHPAIPPFDEDIDDDDDDNLEDIVVTGRSAACGYAVRASSKNKKL